ncbi:hypothetical protein QE429_002981 [Bacillus sp. SORGH_AS 510]|uniref:hypothetical protein n=1 Tax=Bacillus sp. SORGH_AS_0510 TaxID=3041771 RepID=UPI00277E0A2F|nr:hypothetical protein [Bacillus sp. SORGH_AS_0510]MDQ1146154.1 hypothetical protein [Bacillus sp. SORGH_AS_0510]
MKKPGPKTRSNKNTKTESNQTFSNRVLRAEFDDNWKTTITSTGYVKYTALEDNAKVEVLLSDNTSRLVVFPKDGYLLVGSGGTTHFSKPHLTITI